MQEKVYIRIPYTTDKSLQAWNAADEHIVKYLAESDNSQKQEMMIFHDRFGVLTDRLSDYNPYTLWYMKSQKVATEENAVDQKRDHQLSVLENISCDCMMAILKIPKSLDLLEFYFQIISRRIYDNGSVVAGFMTKHFSKAILDLAALYFDKVEQSQAFKKSRLLLLSEPKKEIPKKEPFNEISFNGDLYKQYFGVFSSGHIDYATQFLLEHLEVSPTENSFLDVGCGNGVISKFLLRQKEWEAATMMDDSILAVESTLLNLTTYPKVTAFCEYNFDLFENDSFDLIITNPPFHFEYEVDPSIALALLEGAHRILSATGRLIIVANRHLNYKTHLSNWYGLVHVISENKKFIIYECFK